MKEMKTPRAGRSHAKVFAAFRHGLAKLNLSDQKAIFNRLPPGIRAALWKDRLREAMDTSLTKAQKEILQKIEEQITPAVYDDRSSTQRKRFVTFYQKLQPKALAAFGPDAKKLVAISTLLGERNDTPRIAQSPGLPPCNCSIAARQSSCGL